MEILETPVGDAVVMQVSGRVTSNNAAGLLGHLTALLGRGVNALVVDLAGLDHITSAGLRALLLAEKQALASGARIVLCGLRPLVHEVFDISGMLEVFTVAAARGEALRLMATGPVHG